MNADVALDSLLQEVGIMLQDVAACSNTASGACKQLLLPLPLPLPLPLHLPLPLPLHLLLLLLLLRRRRRRRLAACSFDWGP